MAEDTEDKSSKTEEPTEKKLKEARKKGDVASTREASTMTGVFGLFLICAFLAPVILPQISVILGSLFDVAGQIEIGVDRAGVADLGSVAEFLVRSLAPYLGMLAVLMILSGLMGVGLQGDVTVALERIKPKGSHLSLLSGFKRVFGGAAFVEFLKNVVKLAVVAIITLTITRIAVTDMLPGAVALPEAQLSMLQREAARMLLAVVALLVPIAIADALWKRFQWLKKHRMSQKDIKDEHKNAEGSPEIKRRRAEIRDRQSRNRIQTKVPGAAVVLTNPTHYAIALRYDRGTDVAPVCVAKGTDLMAAQIRRVARDHDVAIIENRALARTLYAEAEIDQVIPAAHWQAVAQIVGYVLDLKARLYRTPPPGSTIRVED